MRLPGPENLTSLLSGLPDTVIRRVLVFALGLVMATFFSAAIFFFSVNNPFEHTENNILDLLLRFRASTHAPPSEDVVFLAFDLATIQYAREHPELGIGNRFLPRDYLGKVTDYLNKQGVRAIVFDVEFDDATTPENDRPLAEAFESADHGNVTLAIRTDIPWPLAYPWAKRNDETLDPAQETKRIQETRLGENGFLFFNFFTPRLLLPQYRLNHVFLHADPHTRDPFQFIGEPLTYKAFLANRESSLDVLIPPVVEPQFLIDSRKHAFNLYALKEDFMPAFRFHRLTELRNKSPGDIIYEDLYEQRCLVNTYMKYYPDENHPFLQQLLEDAIPVTFPEPPPREARSTYTYCYANPVHEQFLTSDNVHLGISSIIQDKDAFMRDIPFLYRSYQGTYHTYIGVRPALEILQPQYISYTPELLVLDDREIPLVDQRDIIINWRDPKNLVIDILNNGVTANVRKKFRHRNLQIMHFAYGGINSRLREPARFEYFPHTSAGFFFLSPRPATLEDLQAQRRLWDAIIRANQFHYASDEQAKIEDQSRKFSQAYQDLDVIAIEDVNVKNKNDLHEEDIIQMLGGHLYRKVSVIDVLKEINLAEKAEGEKIYRLRNQPISGEFSFKDKIVIYGDAVKDVHQTPMGVVYGPEVVATAIDMMLNDREFVRFTPQIVTIASVLLWVLLIFGAMVVIRSIYLAVGLSLAAIMAYWMLVVLVFFQSLYVTPLILPSAIMVIGLILSTVYRYYIQEADKRQLTSAFSKYVSPQLMDEIVANPATAMENLKGSKKELTVLFSDLRNFTSTFEEEDPEVMVVQLNEYFDVMTEIIINNNGTYDKYMGDAIMAFFGAPADFHDHAYKACKTAIEMREALKILNRKWKAEGKSELGLGIGLSTGQMFVGNFGSERIKNFTVMGSTVNLGARLEAYTRQAGMEVVISYNTFKQAEEKIIIKELGFISVKGFSEPVEVYGLRDLADPSQIELHVVETIVGEAYLKDPDNISPMPPPEKPGDENTASGA